MEQYISKSALLAEIERLVNNYDKALDYEAALEDVRDFIDSIEVKEIQVKESTEIERDKETCKENGDSLTQEPVNVWHDMSEVAENGRNIIIIDPQNFYGAVLRKGGSQLRNHNRKSFVKWAYIDDLLNLSNVEQTAKNLKKPVNDELEETANNYVLNARKDYLRVMDEIDRYIWNAFEAGAKWQAEQFEKNRLAACDRQVEEDAEIERDFVMGIIENEHRQPTFDDAIKYGMRLQKKQMIANTADAMIGLPYENKDGGYTHLVDVSRPLPVGDNKIVIIYKED